MLLPFLNTVTDYVTKSILRGKGLMLTYSLRECSLFWWRGVVAGSGGRLLTLLLPSGSRSK